eukprot:12260-Heterococcus_DN1.PRE.1
MSSSQQPVTPGDRFQSFDTTSRTGSSKTPASAAGTGMMRASMRTPVTANHETAMSQRSTMSVAESVITRSCVDAVESANLSVAISDRVKNVGRPPRPRFEPRTNIRVCATVRYWTTARDM